MPKQTNGRVLVNQNDIKHIKGDMKYIREGMDKINTGVVWWKQVAIICTGVGVILAAGALFLAMPGSAEAVGLFISKVLATIL